MTDCIERTVDLDAPIGRVWKALADHREFGTWFRFILHEPFEAGKVTTGEVISACHEGVPVWVRVEAVEEPSRFSFSWPMDETVGPDDPDIGNKTTLVEFTLEPRGEGTRMTVRESGFDRLPDDRRLQVFRDNQGGWDAQMLNIRAYVG